MKTLATSLIIGLCLAAPVQAAQIDKVTPLPGITSLTQSTGQASPATVQLAARTRVIQRSFRRLGSSSRRTATTYSTRAYPAKPIRSRTANRRYMSAQRRLMRQRAHRRFLQKNRRHF